MFDFADLLVDGEPYLGSLGTNRRFYAIGNFNPIHNIPNTSSVDLNKFVSVNGGISL